MKPIDYWTKLKGKAMNTIVDKKHLCYGYPFNDGPAKSGIFGELVKLAASKLLWYQGDLYHDAMWIERNITEPTTFFYGVRETGTSIGFDQYLVGINNPHLYMVVVEEANRVGFVVSINEITHATV